MQRSLRKTILPATLQFLIPSKVVIKLYVSGPAHCALSAGEVLIVTSKFLNLKTSTMR